MENLKIQSTVTSENRPSFNEWAQELKVSSGYYVVGQKETKLPQTYKVKKVSLIEFIKNIIS